MKRALLVAVAAIAFSGVPAMAGGSGSGSSSPSSSAPSYDPVEEYQSGVEALQAGEYKKAERAFKRVTKVAKKDANTRYMLGLAHLGQEEYKAAAKSLEKAVKYDAKLYRAHAKLGMTYLKLEKPEKADQVLAALADASMACASSCPESADIAAAIAEIEAARGSAEPLETSSLAPVVQQVSLETGDVLYSEALRLINLGAYDEAIAELREAGTILGPHPDVLTYIGFANRKMGERETALSFYTAALSIAPDHLSANEYLGEYYVELGDLDRAQAQLDKLNTLCPFGCEQTEELSEWIANART
ncbi:MAG: tetratricopeptide repeat protein [Henriciella sp.]|nr:tetratricopeptide repeat protein [Henriciella sp.]